MDGPLPDGETGGEATRLVHFATITSRVDALTMATALEHEGIYVWIGGEHHAGVDPMSVALGGYRMFLFEADVPLANALADELDWADAEIVFEGQKKAVSGLLAFLLGYGIFWGVPGFIMGAFPALTLALMPLSLLTTPVDPRGRNEFHTVSGSSS